eukprot:TRINITY_DN37439_c0_g1_i1.p1 TRINITY_DN37439_c0_g1~~TRINITY_DN37439_c0_g1_i1.p1  ORF type:complete len:293 (+),score=59.18 TRINITY_DN37439_c0_g1_i1:214-1092(+)
MERGREGIKVRIRALNSKLEWVTEMKKTLDEKLTNFGIEKGILSSMAIAQQSSIWQDGSPTVWPLMSDSFSSVASKRKQHSFSQREESLRQTSSFIKSLPLREISLAKNEQKIRIIQEDLVTLSELRKTETRAAARLQLLQSEEQTLFEAYQTKRLQLIKDTKKLVIEEQQTTNTIYNQRKDDPFFDVSSKSTAAPGVVFDSSLPDPQTVRDQYPLYVDDLSNHFAHVKVSIQDAMRGHQVQIKTLEQQTAVFQNRITQWEQLIAAQANIERDNAIRSQAVAQAEILLMTHK